MKIAIFTTGGTIDKIYFDAKSVYQVGVPAVELILREGGVSTPFEIVSLMKKDSLDLTQGDRELIRDSIRGHQATHCIVTHGTDTMIETAKVVSEIKDKVVVFTGALQPAHSKTTDANFNIGCALGVLLASQPGVYIAMNGRIWDPFKVRKNMEKNEFEEI